jgi:hypothetical protein
MAGRITGVAGSFTGLAGRLFGMVGGSNRMAESFCHTRKSFYRTVFSQKQAKSGKNRAFAPSSPARWSKRDSCSRWAESREDRKGGVGWKVLFSASSHPSRPSRDHLFPQFKPQLTENKP